MSAESSLKELIRMLIKENTPLFITEGVVARIYEDSASCDVIRDDLPMLYKVRLNAVLEPAENAITVFPKIGSSVLCALVENNPADAFVLDAENVEKVIFQGGNNGGLTITPELKSQLEKTNELLTAIIDIINGTPIAEQGNGNPSALQATLKSAISGKSLGDFSSIENIKIKH